MKKESENSYGRNESKFMHVYLFVYICNCIDKK